MADYRTLFEARERLQEVNAQIDEIQRKFRNRKFDEEAEYYWREAHQERDQLREEIAEGTARQEHLESWPVTRAALRSATTPATQPEQEGPARRGGSIGMRH